MRTRNDDSLGWVGAISALEGPWRGLFAPGRGNISFGSPEGVRGALMQVALGAGVLSGTGSLCALG